MRNFHFTESDSVKFVIYNLKVSGRSHTVELHFTKLPSQMFRVFRRSVGTSNFMNMHKLALVSPHIRNALGRHVYIINFRKLNKKGEDSILLHGTNSSNVVKNEGRHADMAIPDVVFP
jgi:hypothetical protein